MVDGAVAAADVERVGVSDRLVQPVRRPLGGGVRGGVDKQARGQGGRQRAARAVRVGSVYARHLDDVHLAGRGDQRVRGVRAREVAALDQHADAGVGGERGSLSDGGIEIGRGCAAGEHSQFRDVGGEHRGVVTDQLAQRVFRIRAEQAVAGGGHHDGVNHDNGDRVLSEERGHGGGGGGVAEHADLDGVDADIIEHRVELGREKLLRRVMDLAHAAGVLRHEGGDHGHTVTAGGGDGLEIRLDSRATGGSVPAMDKTRGC